ncbi:hypothetical protein EPA93_47535 [Ktedonosporobacter rubrisoli]|uniref:Uncharacterized protein n=1 Tax=Ktedonosporobacter rubrisoli TaxID=2509675 RepID=A0A4P6K5H5_KTERU|nr:hypothetical protein [Ktedonosporobacter rubrisoli]QBD83213.1 hypothetical protein EPA93_47535 [Ktedonosporobacter rubrisoli]
MQTQPYPTDTGPLATLNDIEKKKRLDALVKIWQSDTVRLLEREGQETFIKAVGLDEYRYSVSLRFPEWKRDAVVGQVVALRQTQDETPLLFTVWRQEPLLKTLPDWKLQLPNETIFNIAVRITPGGLGEGSKWATVMPKELIPRYRPGWPTQKEWVAWTRAFDWLSVAVGFIRAMLDSLEK